MCAFMSLILLNLYGALRVSLCRPCVAGRRKAAGAVGSPGEGGARFKHCRSDATPAARGCGGVAWAGGRAAGLCVAPPSDSSLCLSGPGPSARLSWRGESESGPRAPRPERLGYICKATSFACPGLQARRGLPSSWPVEHVPGGWAGHFGVRGQGTQRQNEEELR